MGGSFNPLRSTKKKYGYIHTLIIQGVRTQASNIQSQSSSQASPQIPLVFNEMECANTAACLLALPPPFHLPFPLLLSVSVQGPRSPSQMEPSPSARAFDHFIAFSCLKLPIIPSPIPLKAIFPSSYPKTYLRNRTISLDLPPSAHFLSSRLSSFHISSQLTPPLRDKDENCSGDTALSSSIFHREKIPKKTTDAALPTFIIQPAIPSPTRPFFSVDPATLSVPQLSHRIAFLACFPTFASIDSPKIPLDFSTSPTRQSSKLEKTTAPTPTPT
ncbi:uncharacterized protein CLUP02_11250 [Colletotrichum lupini]|uniref:Uncharacterized protein n=1 Tax=Colletotrichum lupini TaxID=145971 RepID=A0A9Q8SZX8_9PEZI|nr:uncharacterized protein CLUP02_11250 [Colletotrichum lupini]UQC85751.1 hypothetical protein CLUP02_11250 [Colletotrichum lupini]